MTRKMDAIVLSISHSTIFALFFCLMTGSADAKEKDEPIHFICSVPNHDYFNLTALPWYVNMKHPDCLPLYNGNVTTNVSTCQTVMSFCNALSIFGGACENSSVCQRSMKGSLSLGAYSENPFHTSKDLQYGFEAKFVNGTSYHGLKSSSCKLKTLVNFRCNYSAKWEVSSLSVVQAPDPRLVKYDAERCEMTLTFDYAGACPWKRPSDGWSISVGSVLLIMFAVTMALYFVLGCLFNTIRGKSGSQIIPHVNFWSSLVIYVRDGLRLMLCCDSKKPMGAVAYERVSDE